LQKGHTRPLASLLLFCLLVAILLIISSVASTQSSRLRAAGPLLSLDRLQREPLPGPPRQVIGCMECPERHGGVDTQQGPGPDRDDDITPNAVATEELDPSSSPATGANSIAFVSNGEDADADRQIDPTLPDEPEFNLWLMRPDGTQQVQLVDLPGDQREPAFNPSGRLLAYASNQTGTYQIYTIEVSTGVIWQITTTQGNKRHPTWSPDSNWIAFQCDRSGNWDIFKISSTGAGSEVPLAVSPNHETSPAWSPTSPYIAYQTTTGTVQRIFAMDGEGGNVTALSTGGGYPDADDIDPAWQPTGQSLVFSSSRVTGPGDTTNDFNIWRMSAVGEAVGADATIVTLNVLDDAYDDTNPTWTPDLDQRARMRFIFQSTRPDPPYDPASEPDIWATFARDTVPPVLVNGPDREDALPWVDDRNPPPGSDITVYVAVYDKDSGVSSVTATFKDPDIKVYLWWDGARFEQWMGTTPGCHQALEWDCVQTGARPLLDDGVAPDSTAGDGVFTGTYTTTVVPRDYIIDITTTDNEGNSLTYDDIYGFSTITFNPDNRVLFVDDYCEGQRFIADTGYNTDWPAAFPNESYWRYNPGYKEGLEWSTDFDSIAGPFNESYDVWRIICRGQIPDTILRNYLPSSDYQLDPADALASPTTAKAKREVLVANRMVFWAAPHTGDVWVCDGTIMDAATQAQMSQFLDQGGRLFISGQDLAWALTMGDKTTNNFLTTYLRASYYTDAAGTWGFTVGGAATDPVAWDAWVESSSVHYSTGQLFTPLWYEAADNPIDLVTPQNQSSSQPCLCDAAEFSDWADGITPVGNVKMYGYGGFDGTGAGTRYQNFTTGARVAFLSFGFEQIHRRYINAHTPIPAHCANHRSHLAHNAKCWMRTATFQGRVVSISEGGKPVTDPEPVVIATLLAGVREQPEEGDDPVGEVTEYKYAVRCQKDGTYVMQGLNPGHYTFEVIRTGFEIDHGTRSWVHGGQEPVQVDFAIKEAQPGAIAGTVVSEATGDPISNVTIRVYPAPVEEEEEETATASVAPGQAEGDIPIEDLGDPIGEGTSAADGTFVIPGIPPGDYIVVADGTVVGYGTQQLEATVTPGNTTNLAFILGAADGILEVHVNEADTGDDIPDATIEILDENGQQVVAPAPLTDSTGIVNISLPAGTYQVRASRAGYEASPLLGTVVVSQETKEVYIELNTVADGGISGKVVSATTGLCVGGVVIRIMSGDTVKRTTETHAEPPTDPGDGTPPYNYIFDKDDDQESVPAGEVTVVPVVSGYKPQPQQRVVTVLSGKTTTGVSFVLESLHVFPAGLQLISLPWDFSSGENNIDPKDLLGGVDTLHMATWEASSGRYRIYPSAPADRFRLGTGYWLNLAGPTDLAQEGTPAATIHEIPLVPGWNLIGNPFLSSIEFYATSVRDQDGVLRSVQDAMARNVLGSGLFAYMLGGYRVAAALTPYVGYWLNANEPCELVIDESTDTLGVGTQAARPAVPVPADGWLLQLQTTATVAGLQDTAAYIGTAAGASDGFDPGLDQAKPPVPAIGAYVYLSLQGANAPGMAVDIRSQQSKQQQWDVEVQTNLKGQPIEISWPDMSGVPAGTQPILTDLATGKRVYMRTSRAYSFEADAHTRKLRVSTSASGVGQLAITAAVASTKAASAAVSYTLSKNAQVTVDVHNISGRLIRRLVQDQSQAAGLQSVAWNGRSNTGVRVPNGRYLIRITARTEDGQQAQALTQVAIIR